MRRSSSIIAARPEVPFGPPPSQSRAVATGPTGAALVEEVVAAAGLSRLVGRSIIERACLRSGVVPARLTTDDLKLALPQIERVIRVFAPPETVDARVRAVLDLAEAAPVE
jgi:hypothetical protein